MWILWTFLVANFPAVSFNIFISYRIGLHQCCYVLLIVSWKLNETQRRPDLDEFHLLCVAQEWCWLVYWTLCNYCQLVHAQTYTEIHIHTLAIWYMYYLDIFTHSTHASSLDHLWKLTAETDLFSNHHNYDVKSLNMLAYDCLLLHINVYCVISTIKIYSPSGHSRWRWVCFLIKQIWRNLALRQLLTNGSFVVNGCRQNKSPNSW